MLCSQRWRHSIQSAKTRPGADYGSDHEFLIAKFRLKLKKVEKTTRSFRYTLNQIPYDYTVEVTNRLKGLDLIECPKNYRRRFMTFYKRWWSRPSPRKRNAKGKMVVWVALTNSGEKKGREKQRRKGKIFPFEYLWVPKNIFFEFQRIARRDKKSFLSDQCKETEENNRLGKTRDLFKKIRDTKGTFHAKMGIIKDRNSMDLTEADDIKKRWQEYTEGLYKKRS